MGGHLLGVDVPVSLTIFTLRPMRAFLSMIARSMTELAPMPMAGRPEPLVLGELVGLLVVVDPHDVGSRGS